MDKVNKGSIKREGQDYIVPLLVSAVLIIACVIISSKKYYWNDELYSYYLLADQSFSHMLVAFNDKINNTPILYFLLGWVWAKLFGPGELSLRLFSCLGICTAFVVTWITLRRTFGFLPTALGLLTVFCTSGIILSQVAEARMYGLFLAVCSLGLLQFDTLNRQETESRWDLLKNILIHAAIVNTHLFGIFYSGAFLIAQIVWDASRSFFKTRVYGSIVLGCLSLVFYIPSFLNQADAGKPRTWIPIPALIDLTRLMDLRSDSFFQVNILVFIIFAAALLFLLDIFKSNQQKDEYESMQVQQASRDRIEVPLLLLSLNLLLIPIFVWLVSRTIKPIFIERYMIPSALGWCILIAFTSSRLMPDPLAKTSILDAKKNSLARSIGKLGKVFLCFILIGYLILQPIKYAKNFARQERPGINASKYGYPDLPIVIQFGGRFINTFHYSAERQRYFFILDWDAALDENSGLFSPQEFKHLDAFRRVYPQNFKDNIVQSEYFLGKYDRFLVVDHEDYKAECPLRVVGLHHVNEWKDIQCPQWLEKRVLENPNYRVKPLIKQEWETVLLVEKVG